MPKQRRRRKKKKDDPEDSERGRRFLVIAGIILALFAVGAFAIRAAF
jgi:hypothetical protein